MVDTLDRTGPCYSPYSRDHTYHSDHSKMSGGHSAQAFLGNHRTHVCVALRCELHAALSSDNHRVIQIRGPILLSCLRIPRARAGDPFRGQSSCRAVRICDRRSIMENDRLEGLCPCGTGKVVNHGDAVARGGL